MSRKKVALEVVSKLEGMIEPTLKEGLVELMEEFGSRRDDTFFGFEVVDELEEYLKRVKNG